MSNDAANSTTALLVMDIQPIVTPAFGGDEALLERLGKAAAAARAAGVTVVYGRVAFRPGYPDVSADNALFGPLRDMMDFTEANADAGFYKGPVGPQEGDIQVLKRRVSTFAGSDLDVVLRSRNIRHLVLTGVATSGVVLSTLRQAADLDYRLTVLSDGCADGDPEVQRVLMEKVFPMQATIATVDDWVGGL